MTQIGHILSTTSKSIDHYKKCQKKRLESRTKLIPYVKLRKMRNEKLKFWKKKKRMVRKPQALRGQQHGQQRHLIINDKIKKYIFNSIEFPQPL